MTPFHEYDPSSELPSRPQEHNAETLSEGAALESCAIGRPALQGTVEQQHAEDYTDHVSEVQPSPLTVDSRFVVPETLHVLEHQAERAAAALVVEAAEAAAADTQFSPLSDADGTQFLHQGVSVSYVSGTTVGVQKYALERMHPDGMQYGLSTVPVSTWQEVSVTPQSDFPDAPDVTMIAAGIDRGDIQGLHYVTAAKSIEQDSMPEASLLYVGVGKTAQDGQHFPITTVDLHYMRTHQQGRQTLLQATRIVSDPNTGVIQMGDACEGISQITHAGEGVIAEQTITVSDPFVADAAEQLQRAVQPPNATTRALSTDAWHVLVTAPLDYRDLLIVPEDK